MTIMNVRLGINELAAAVALAGQPIPWHALSQTMIIGFQRPDGTAYTTLPDIFVYRLRIAAHRGSVAIALDGPPVLIVEIASESTYASDIDLVRGKGWTYANGGMREYLVLDPTGLFLPEHGRAWRLMEGAYQPWQPDEQGRWHSQELPVAFAVEDGSAGVLGSTGQRQLREGEISGILAQTRDVIAQQQETIAQQGSTLVQQQEALRQKDAELHELRRRLAQFEEA
jgi:hypothetical protein